MKCERLVYESKYQWINGSITMKVGLIDKVFIFKQKLHKYAFERLHRGNIVQNAATAYQNDAELAIIITFKQFM